MASFRAAAVIFPPHSRTAFRLPDFPWYPFCHVLGMPLENLFRIRQDYCCFNVIDNGREGMRLRLMNMGHLALRHGVCAEPSLKQPDPSVDCDFGN